MPLFNFEYNLQKSVALTNKYGLLVSSVRDWGELQGAPEVLNFEKTPPAWASFAARASLCPRSLNYKHLYKPNHAQ